MKPFLNKLFLVKEIRSKDGRLHFRRWRILSTPWFSIFVHGIYQRDEDKHLHNHPWDYVSIVLKGTYIEATKNWKPDWSNCWDFTTRGPLSIVSRDAGQYHKVATIVDGPVYSLFFTSSRYNHWGYSVEGLYVNHRKYRELKNSGKLKQFERDLQ